MSINASKDFPYTSMRSTRWSFGEYGCVEGDSAFVNAPAMRQRDANGEQLPDIVVEVSKSQRYEDLFERLFIFFSDTYLGVKAVVLIKLVDSAPIINEMIAVVVYRMPYLLEHSTSVCGDWEARYGRAVLGGGDSNVQSTYLISCLCMGIYPC